jgi:hypothetical protein
MNNERKLSLIDKWATTLGTAANRVVPDGIPDQIAGYLLVIGRAGLVRSIVVSS